MMTDPRGPVLFDVNNSPPEQVMTFVIKMLRVMGTGMLSDMARELSAGEPEKEFAALGKRVDSLAHEMDDCIGQLGEDRDEILGVIILATLQAGIWAMARYVEAAREIDEQFGEPCGPECDGNHDVDVSPKDVDALLGEDGVDNDDTPELKFDKGVMVRRKVRGDH